MQFTRHMHSKCCAALLLAGVMLAVPGKVIGTPGPYDEATVDQDTVALWHFDERDDDGFTSFTSAVGSYTLSHFGTGTADFDTDNRGPMFGRAVTGFTNKDGLSATITDSTTQTFEAWVMWDDDNNLPTNYTNDQTLMCRKTSSTPWGIIVAFENVSSGNAELKVYIYDSSSTEKTVSLSLADDDMVEGMWYHVAVTVEVADFDSDTNADDTKVQIYWNDQNNIDTTPTATEDTFDDFTYRADASSFRIGKRYNQGQDQMVGLIDEVRYSDVARTEFDTFFEGDMDYFRGTNAFRVFEAFKGHAHAVTGVPTDLADRGVIHMNSFGDHTKWWPVGTTDLEFGAVFPDEARSRFQADKQFDDNGSVLMAIDIENDSAATDPLIMFYQQVTGTPEAVDFRDAIRKLASIADWVHSEEPHMRIGFYNMLPERQFHVINNATNKALWQTRNDIFKELATHVDVVFPNLYTVSANDVSTQQGREDWIEYAETNIAEARKYGKPIYIYLRPRYVTPGTLQGQTIPAEAWREQLEFCYRNADGVIIWEDFYDVTDEWDGDDSDLDNWWGQTVDFMKDKGLWIP